MTLLTSKYACCGSSITKQLVIKNWVHINKKYLAANIQQNKKLLLPLLQELDNLEELLKLDQ